MTDEARKQATEILADATDRYDREHLRATLTMGEIGAECDCDDDCDCRTDEQRRTDAAIHAQLAQAAATMAAAMVALLSQD